MREQIIIEINKLHYSWSYERFCQVYNDMLVKFVDFDDTGAFKDKPNKIGAAKFFTYFNIQWISSCFNLWQIYNTPAGFSTTQSPQESFKKDVKLTFTDYCKLTVHECLQALMVTIINYYSVNMNPFSLIATPNELCIKKSKSLELKSNRFLLTHSNNILYQNDAKTSTFCINLDYKSCTCTYYLDKKICLHLIAASKIFKRDSGLSNEHDEFYTAKKGTGRLKNEKRVGFM